LRHTGINMADMADNVAEGVEKLQINGPKKA
jgi:hypothetical protein